MAQTFLRGAKTENLSNGAIFAPFLCRAYTHDIILYRYILFHILIYNRLTNARQPVFIRKKHCCTAVFLRHLYAAAATVQAEREFSAMLDTNGNAVVQYKPDAKVRSPSAKA